MILKVKKVKQETPNAFSVIFQKPNNFSFYPGQYIEIEGRSFTIASSPSESCLMITTRPGLSKFKKKLARIVPGGILKSSHPAGTFTIDEIDPAVFLAGGIGITPFRSMIKWALDRKLNLPMTLIYSNSNPDFICKEELGKWQKALANLAIHYIVTNRDGRLDKTKLATAIGKFVNKIFYLAGPPGFVDDVEKILLELKIDETRVRTDRFDGY